MASGGESSLKSPGSLRKPRKMKKQASFWLNSSDEEARDRVALNLIDLSYESLSHNDGEKLMGLCINSRLIRARCHT